jgi:hypothetical protein
MTKLVDRLRQSNTNGNLCNEAAAEIERLKVALNQIQWATWETDMVRIAREALERSGNYSYK